MQQHEDRGRGGGSHQLLLTFYFIKSKVIIIKVILSLPHNKMPGESQIAAEALKALSPEALATIANAVIAYWEDKTDATQVQKAILIALPKKGDLSQPKNCWRPS
jgi:hypothetical protein